MMEELCLKDIWRNRNEETREYSWRKGGDITKASRIDYALVSAGLDQHTEYVTYISALFTDHRALYMVVNINPVERGTGYWKVQHYSATELRLCASY